jgi:hypothetical protein
LSAAPVAERLSASLRGSLPRWLRARAARRAWQGGGSRGGPSDAAHTDPLLRVAARDAGGESAPALAMGGRRGAGERGRHSRRSRTPGRLPSTLARRPHFHPPPPHQERVHARRLPPFLPRGRFCSYGWCLGERPRVWARAGGQQRATLPGGRSHCATAGAPLHSAGIASQSVRPLCCRNSARSVCFERSARFECFFSRPRLRRFLRSLPRTRTRRCRTRPPSREPLAGRTRSRRSHAHSRAPSTLSRTSHRRFLRFLVHGGAGCRHRAPHSQGRQRRRRRLFLLLCVQHFPCVWACGSFLETPAPTLGFPRPTIPRWRRRARWRWRPFASGGPSRCCAGGERPRACRRAAGAS